MKFLGQLTSPSLSIKEQPDVWDEEGLVIIGASPDEFVASRQSLSEALSGITSISASKGDRMGNFHLTASRNGGPQEFLARLHKFQEQFGGTFKAFSLGRLGEEISLDGIDVSDLFGRRNRFMEIWENVTSISSGDWDGSDLQLTLQQPDSLGEFFEQIQEFLGALSFEAQVYYLSYTAAEISCISFKGISAPQLSASYDALHAFKGIQSLDLK